MKENAIKKQPSIEQTLHGYEAGHRLLAQSCALTEEELGLLDRFSDLSGHLPLDTTFDSYLSGYPCGRYYAFARTYLDSKARRAGTVLTHTLLVEQSVLVLVSDPDSICGLHKRPTSSTHRASYRFSLPWPELGLNPPFSAFETSSGSVDFMRQRALLTLFFGQSDRPLLWQDGIDTWPLVRYLWSLLWPAARAQFAFCTFALQTRRLSNRPFDFLALPSEAYGAFREIRDLRSWYLDGAIKDVQLRSVISEAWVEELASLGTSWLKRQLTFATEQGLPEPLPGTMRQLTLLHRLFLTAEDSLQAAQGCADLLQALYPRLSYEALVWTKILEYLRRNQHAAPLLPQPLWHLTDLSRLMSRGTLASVLAHEPEFLQRMADTLHGELLRRLAAQPELSIAALPDLLQAVPVAAWREQVYVAAEQLVRTEESSYKVVPWAVALLRGWLDTKDQGLALAALRPLSSILREQTLTALVSGLDSAQKKELARACMFLADLIADRSLVVGCWAALGEQPTIIDEYFEEISQNFEFCEAVQRWLAKLPPEQTFDWALQVTNERELPFAVENGYRAIGRLNIDTSELAARCAQSRTGALLFAYSIRYSYRDEVSTALSKEPRLAVHLVVLCLEGEHSGGLSFVAREALWRLEPVFLLSEEIRNAVIGASSIDFARDVLIHVGQSVLLLIYDSSQDPSYDSSKIRAWLQTPQLQQQLNREYLGNQLFARFPSGRPPQDLLPRLVSFISALAKEDSPPNTPWLTSLLSQLLDYTSRDAMETVIPELLALLRRAPNREEKNLLASSILVATQKLRPPSGYLCIESTLPLLYPYLVSSDPPGFFTRMAIWFLQVDGWDKGKFWRHFILDTWITEKWPLDSFLRTLDGNPDLRRQVLKRASKTKTGIDFLIQLKSAVSKDKILSAHWMPDLERALC